MKNQDLVSKRILTLALAVSMILCSGSLFVFSLNFSGKAKAATVSSPATSAKSEAKYATGDAGFIAGVGISNGFAYYVYLAPDGHSNYWKANLSAFKDSNAK